MTQPDQKSVPPVTAELAQWAATLEAETVPESVMDDARLLVLDGLGCALHGVSQPWTRIVTEFVTEGGGKEEASVWGTPLLVPATSAPLVNGTAMHAFEYDDLHPEAVLHAGAQVLPATFAAVELLSQGTPNTPRAALTEQEMLTAIVIGFEAGARIGRVTGAGQLARGFHPSPNTATFAAAAAASRILGLDAERTANALGVAGSFGGYLMAAQYGAMVKRVHPGHSSQSGLVAALLAARGLTGTDRVLEAAYGGFASAYSDVGGEHLAEITQALGARWETSKFSIKFYPCCGSNHTSIDAWWSIRDRAPYLVDEELTDIEVKCSTLTAEHVGWTYRPGSVTTAQMNLQFCLAAAIVDGRFTVEQVAPERLADPKILSIVDRIRVRADPRIDALGRDRRHHVEVTVTTSGGQTFTAERERAKGSAEDPLSHDEVVAKFQLQATQLLTEDAATELRQRILSFGSRDPLDVLSLTRLLRTEALPTNSEAAQKTEGKLS
jgi:aconitate decarboxylase